MPRNVLVINGHPDPRPERYCAALCDAYRAGANEAGHSVTDIAVGALNSLGCGSEDPDDIRAAHRAICQADRLLLVFPLWVDQAPLVLRQFFSRLAAFSSANCPGAQLAIRPESIRTVVTMDMPALAHRAAARCKAGPQTAQPDRGVAVPGLNLAQPTFIGSVRHIPQSRRVQWIEDLHACGLRAA